MLRLTVNATAVLLVKLFRREGRENRHATSTFRCDRNSLDKQEKRGLTTSVSFIPYFEMDNLTQRPLKEAAQDSQGYQSLIHILGATC